MVNYFCVSILKMNIKNSLFLCPLNRIDITSSFKNQASLLILPEIKFALLLPYNIHISARSINPKSIALSESVVVWDIAQSPTGFAFLEFNGPYTWHSINSQPQDFKRR
jgi:hypothetical protein